ncbi:MAG: U32 family peptidase [Rhodocyclaceae bacterium]|nr:U32 family peptidase [Rhodocyclaceae bacterium]
MSPLVRSRCLELLAPAKTAEIGREAIRHGADAVYIGGPSFGARHNATNAIADIAALVEFAHRFHARVFVTLNTILHDAELVPARSLIRQCWDVGVDALIVQDLGLLEIDLPPIELHASTQCDIRTPAKARFLADAGFSQIVLARELTIAQIADVRAALEAETIVEHFIHGALCVAYSGQCYISHAHTGRSANRGDCSQACRLPYTLKDTEGRVVAFEKHLLSMKDNNQSGNLEALVDAGVRSFKIEGRYKEMDYVKNITGHYRRLLDEILTRRPEFSAASSGHTQLSFAPDPDKSFHRGATDYFAHGRGADIGAFDSPTYVGTPLGPVTRVGPDWFELASAEPLANGDGDGDGDGLNYTHKRAVVGLQANRVERLEAPGRRQWRVWPNERIGRLAGLRPEVEIRRNRDHAWEQVLAGRSAERRIRIRAELTDDDAGLTLTLADEDGIRAKARASLEYQPPRDVSAAEAALRAGLDRFGTTDFALQTLAIRCQRPWFVPASVTKRLRRHAVAALVDARRSALLRPLRRPAVEPPPSYPDDTLSYLANVYNHATRAFYARHGVKLMASAYEAHEQAGEVSLMITKHCLRYAFSLCPKQAKGVAGVQGQVGAEPMTLVGGNERLTLRFDCRACEMHVVGAIKKHVLSSPPPTSVPAVAITFHRARPRS